ncbi:MAG: hypothetical protein KDJ52_17915 [Anaerolineae bacterium]|nr:hypothetical protein [Anaerolineae bacterium]
MFNTEEKMAQMRQVSISSFQVIQKGIVFKRPKWKVNIFPERIKFTSLDDNEQFHISKEQSKNHVMFASILVSGFNVKINHEGKDYRFKLAARNLDELRSWMTPKTASELAAEIKQALVIRGGGLILVGIAHFLFSSYLDPIWGGALIFIGILNLTIFSRYMILANGVLLIMASVLNCSVGLTAASEGAKMLSGFAFLQLIWGLEEMVLFREFGRSEKRTKEYTA